MIADFVLSIVDYILVFFITLIAVFLGMLGAFMVSLHFVVDKIAERVSPTRREYMNEHEKKYRRKTV